MKHILWIMGVMLISIQQDCEAQIYKLKHGFYKVDEKSYASFDKLAPIFAQDEKANFHFLKYKKHRRNQKYWIGAMIGSFTIGAIVGANTPTYQGGDSPDYSAVVPLIYGLSGSAISFLGWAYSANRTWYYKGEALYVYNSPFDLEMSFKTPREKRVIISQSNNGLGLTLLF